VNLERDDNFVSPTATGGSDESEFGVVRAGLNFKFGTY
jgi:hypothetical protein